MTEWQKFSQNHKANDKLMISFDVSRHAKKGECVLLNNAALFQFGKLPVATHKCKMWSQL